MSIELTAVSFDYQVRSITTAPWYRNLLRRKEVSVNIYHELDFSLNQPATIYGLLGKNGSGKTTLIKLMTGILQPASGRISVLGEDPVKRSKKLLRQIGVMFGHKSMLWPELSLQENIKLFEHIYRRTYNVDILTTKLQKLSLVEVLDKPTKTFSLGQSVKANLLIHLLNQPKLMILDEPTIGLDVESAIALRKTLIDFCQKTRAIVLITSHNMMDIAEVCDQVHFVKSGRIESVEALPFQSTQERAKYLESLFL